MKEGYYEEKYGTNSSKIFIIFRKSYYNINDIIKIYNNKYFKVFVNKYKQELQEIDFKNLNNIYNFFDLSYCFSDFWFFSHNKYNHKVILHCTFLFTICGFCSDICFWEKESKKY